MHVGATLRLLRTSSGVSLSTLAQHVGVSVSYLSRVEHGHDPAPTLERLRSIAACLHLPPERLTDLVDELRPDAADWLGRSPAGRRLAAELRRRQLGEAQLARVLRLVEREFPLAQVPGATIASLLSPERILMGVQVPRLREAIEIAAMRLTGPGLCPPLVGALLAREELSPSCIGGGLCLPHSTLADGVPRAALVLLGSPVPTPSPDGLPLRAILVLAELPPGPPGVAILAQAAELADPSLLEELARAPSPGAALEQLTRHEARGG